MKILHQVIPVIGLVTAGIEENVYISTKNLQFALKTLKLHINSRYTLLTSIAGVDYLYSKYRFGIAYDLLSLVHNSRIRLKIFINEITFVETAEDTFLNAN